MPVKLNKVIKDLNVGLTTVVEYLNKKGFTIDSNPNVKINDEQWDLLKKEFGGTPPPKKTGMFGFFSGKSKQSSAQQRPPQPVKEEIKITPEPASIKIIDKIDLHDKKEKTKIHTRTPEKKDVVSNKKPAPQTTGEKTTPKPVVAAKPQVNTKPVVNTKPDVNTKPAVAKDASRKAPSHQESQKTTRPPLEKPKDKPAAVTPTMHKEGARAGDRSKSQQQKPSASPVGAQKQQSARPQTTAPAKPAAPPTMVSAAPTEKKDEVFRLKPPKPLVSFKVIDKMTPAELEKRNQSTSPRKKSKNVKRRERAERIRQQAEQQRKGSTPAGTRPTTNTRPADKTSKPNAHHSDKSRQQSQSQPPKTGGAQTTDAAGKHKRQRIKIKERVDVNNTPGTNARRDDRNKQTRDQRPKRPVRAVISDEDVQKQVKETLARLTDKTAKGKGAKYRREKRDAAADREREMLAVEERESRVLKLTEFVTANDLANMMNIPVTQVISTCMSIGIMVSINQRMDAETINIVAEEFGYTTEYVSADVVEAITEDEDKTEDLLPRSPIVTVMGHVDHGKTSLLDNIRKSNVIAGEAGGITQHIGAYNVKLPNGRYITFLDTPGHEAFTAMRARGAKVTDIAIIIVAADDSVMPQTIEAINHASAAGVPIVFAINKIDKPHANIEKIKEQLASMNYLVEDWGGKYQCQEISAKQGINVPELLEKVLLEADMLELKANPKRRAIGSIIESSLDKGRGFVSTVLVSNGTLKQGDIVLAGTHYGRVKAMFNERNIRIEQAGPSEPALILGLDGAPQAGDSFHVLETEQEAREIASRREQLQRELGLRTQKRFGLEELGRRRALGDFHELNLIVKGDVDGSVEAISDSLIKLSTPEIQVNVIHKAVGQISESDISLAATANAVIIGFQVRPSVQARRLAENEGVEIRLYSIIYDAINDVKSAMEGMLSPEIHEEQNGEVEVLQVFKITKVGTVAGCIVKDGKIKRANKVRLIRDGIVIHTGDLGSLKRFKDEVKEVYTGQDCGIYINNFNDIQVGDIIEAFDQIEVKKTL